ncbi:UbiE/COQ5 methyltransferase [Symmachiella macrocystis]|uniref:Demethylmenaquinone methyltransferase n=2 Tax=Symmachiella macrocystis TaxID=2527985 RepID=A0A5C6BQI4_9PLAN|nr:UbiE/COQ5 methyltransferase [Symmachiella macrocystis]
MGHGQMTVDKSGGRVRRMFGEISPRYDFLNHFLSGGTDIYWRWRAVRMAPPVGDAPILDVCTGTGDLAFSYEKRAQGAAVIGSDFTHEMLVLANKKREAASGSRIEFLEADAQRLPFADDSFQIVSVAFGLRNVADTMQGLQEMTRVCQPGGKVVVLEFSMPENRLFRSCYRWYFRHILPRIGQLLARNSQFAYNYLPQSVSEFAQGETLATMMKQAGLASVIYKPLTFGIATLYVGTK